MTVISGKAREACAEVDIHADYYVIKMQILAQYEILPKASQIKLQEKMDSSQKNPADVLQNNEENSMTLD